MIKFSVGNIVSSVLLFTIFFADLARSSIVSKGVNIGYTCVYDKECQAGNGEKYSICSKRLSTCICAVTHLGERICDDEREKADTACKRQAIYDAERKCPVECTLVGTNVRKWTETEDWYGRIIEPFASFIHDKKTAVCYDPERDVHSLPDGFVIKPSSIPNAGLGVFTEVYVEQDTVFGPFKGIVESETDTDVFYEYSWSECDAPELGCCDIDLVIKSYNTQVKPDQTRKEYMWIHGENKATSNWLRYFNTPTSGISENIVAFQYKELLCYSSFGLDLSGELFYLAFKSIRPGTELLLSYGENYRIYLGIENYNTPAYFYSEPGYVGGDCPKDQDGYACDNDDNTICADEMCLCVPRTHNRAGICIKDETLGGVCTGSNGESCKQDMNAECQRGICVCKSIATPANGMCRPAETFGGMCGGHDGQGCLLDGNAVCVHGICRCKYGTTGMGGICMKDETYQGRCIKDDGEECDQDENAECKDNVCVCKSNAKAVNGVCVVN